MDLRNLFVLTPTGRPDPSMAIAACRAGARGILDLEYAGDPYLARAAVDRLQHAGQGPFGVKLGHESQPILEALLAHRPWQWKWVLLAGGEHAELPAWVERLHENDLDVLLEVTSSRELELAERLGVDGVILKGNEAGGRVGDETAFVLLQHWYRRSANGQRLPAWVQGGVGLNTAAACAALGASGVVLDGQMLLTRESAFRTTARGPLTAFDGSETLCLGSSFGESYRIYKRPGSPAVEALLQTEQRLETAELSRDEKLAQWRNAIREQVVSRPGELVFLSQDACFAAGLAEKYVTVSGVLQALVEQVRHNLNAAQDLLPLGEGAPLAESHGTRFPILQGPMTRVSDTAQFADSVARAGGLPFLALALLRKKAVETLLAETTTLLEDRSWGVGLLGFLPPEIRKEQTEAVLAAKPPFALIAGGRPDMAQELEDQGIPTYLHVPSPGLLKMFLKDGAKRFIFEGRECGGHVGPRGSFLLWETMVGLLLDHLGPNGRGDELHVVFAGGIHDGASSAAVAALAASLAERGVKVGVLMGTAYLFTQEAVAAGAIVPRFQKEALTTAQTVLLETGPGHAIRCIGTPYFEHFNAEKRRLQKEGKSPEEITRALEWMNMGRLRVASKGIERMTDETGVSKLAELPEDDQFTRGMYMIGQVAAMHDRVISMEELHEEVCGGGVRLLEALAPPVVQTTSARKPCDIAIVGMSCFYPKAAGMEQFWENILNKVYAVQEVPGTHWDWRLYYDSDPRAKDKSISKWGGFMEDVPFDPQRYGITPVSVKAIEPLQLLLLEAVRFTIDDAGYTNRPFNREKTCAVVGIGGGGAPLSVAYGFRACLPLFATVPELDIDVEHLVDKSTAVLPEWTEDSFPGFLNNVTVGRVANRFNFGGMNMGIDAACASSLAALYDCVRELENGTSDVAFAMGADAVMTPFAYTAFSKTHALSARGRCSPFDAAGDGIVLSEGIGVVMLKRLADAERDGDTIYAVIKGVGSSSDGREKGLTAPNHSGQVRALKRAYENANISPRRVGLVEAHGTGTVVGDHTEAKALISVYQEAGADLQACALGSVKSMIGHTKCAAGLAGLIKSAKALHHKVLPPTLVERPNPRINFETSPLYLNAEARPWIHGGEEPRCAAVSAFGFGGTNFHAVLEEYTGEYRTETPPAQNHWPAELLVWRRGTRADLIQAVERVQTALDGKALPELAALAASLWKSNTHDSAHPTLAVVASSLDDLKQKLPDVLAKLRSDETLVRDPRGIYFAEQPSEQGGKVAFLFPGQGSQYPNMLAQVGMNFPEIRRTFDSAERTLHGKWEKPLGRYIYPASTFTPEEDRRVLDELANTEVAQPALGAAGLGMYRLLEALGVQPDFLAGHSYGEYVALCAAGAMSEEDLIRVSYERGRLINAAAGSDAGGMVAIDADGQTAAGLIDGIDGVWVANLNSPSQTVVSGTDTGLKTLLARLQERKVRGRRIPVACAFHSSLVADAARPLATVLSDIAFQTPARTVFSNTLGHAYPTEPDAMAATLANHLASPVQWQPEIEALAAAGAKVFVEVGPQGVLTGLVKQILGDTPHIAVATDLKGRNGLVQLQHCLAQLLVSGVPVELERLYRDREVKVYELSRLEQDAQVKPLSPMTWLVNGVRQRLHNQPEPYVLGQVMNERVPSANGGTKPKAASNGSGDRLNGAATNGSSHAAASSPPPAAAPAANGLTNSNGHHSPAAHGNGHANGHAANGNGHASANGHTVSPTVPSAPAPQMTYGPAVDEATVVMQGFQNLMGRFLDTQRSVMLAYLQGDAGEVAHAPVNPVALPYMPAPAPQPMPAPTPQAAPQAAPAPVAAPPTATETAPAETALAQPKAPVPVPPAAPQPKADAAPSRDSIADQLLDLVSERTGYPKDMLGLDLDLEGELGIDSIKRVEILGTLAESLGTDEMSEGGGIELEQLTSLRTLRGILDYLDGALANPNPPQPAPSIEDVAGTPTMNDGAAAARNGAAASTNGHAFDGLDIQRGLVRLIDAPLPSGVGAIMPGGTIVVTDDGGGVAAELAARLADFDVNVTLVRMAGEGVKGWTADLTDAAAVADLIGRIREEAGPVGGFIHLMPLQERQPGDDWASRGHRDVKAFYLLARELEKDLRSLGEDGGAVLMTATALGGRLGFGDEPLPESYLPGDGGVIGFAKCVVSEWPEVMVRVVDLNLEEPVGDLAEHILNELQDPEGPLEIGHADGRRLTWEPYQTELDTDGEPLWSIEPGDTILLTGGARGITAVVAEELARRHQPNVVLVGRSPMPPEAEAADTASLTKPADVKAAIMRRFQAEGRQFTPAAVEETYKRLLQDREIRGNLDRIRAAGATVHYRSVDVRDESQMAELFRELNETFGGVDGVIHGAGIIEDKLVKDKTPDSFDRVYGTKVGSAASILRHVDPQRLKFCVFFSSISSRFGNMGQCDYAAANEVLSKLAWQLDRQWPGRVLAVCWGPWGSVGMASHLEEHLVKRGLKVISPTVGATMMADELLYGRRGESEILAAGGEEHEVRPKRSRHHANTEPAATH